LAFKSTFNKRDNVVFTFQGSPFYMAAIAASAPLLPFLPTAAVNGLLHIIVQLKPQKNKPHLRSYVQGPLFLGPWHCTQNRKMLVSP